MVNAPDCDSGIRGFKPRHPPQFFAIGKNPQFSIINFPFSKIKMPTPFLILTTGLPCTGKTTFATRLSKDLNLPLVSKDEIKELLFDSLGVNDRSWSKRLGSTAFELLYWSIDKHLSAGQSLIVDVDFSNPKIASERLTSLSKEHNFVALTINLFTEGKVLFERFKNRSLGDERHPGHVDHSNFDEFRPVLLVGKREDVILNGKRFEIDTSDFDAVEYDSILKEIRHETSKLR